MPKKWLTEQEAVQYLASQKEGRLATCDADGQPYIVALNYVMYKGKIYIHSAHQGRKLDNIAHNPKVCFEVSQTDKTIFGPTACKCTTRYTSVLVFGTASIVQDIQEKIDVLNALTAHFANGQPFNPIPEQAANTCTVVAISIETISGKQNIDPEC